jgi:hypothetical protein
MALPEGYSFTRPSDRMYSSVMPRPGMRFAYGPGGERKEVPSSNSSGGSSSGATPMNPVLDLVDRREVISDPALRELYFGSTDTPGLIAQATQAAQKSYLDQPALLQGTAGLTAQEQRARELAQQGIGSYQPFLEREQQLIGRGISDLETQRGLLGEALGGYRSAFGAQQPYFGAAESQLGAGLGGLFSSLGYGGPSARQLLGQSLQGYDPRMAGQFYNPFEQQVVQQTIQDVLKAGEMQDIQQRASDIARGGESAFGSRARLTAQERQESLGRGLGDVLSKIRSGGFETSQQRALQELENLRSGARAGAQLEAGFGGTQSAAQRQYAQDLLGLGQGRSAAARQLAGDISGVGSGIAGIGAGLAGYGTQLGRLGETQQRLRGQDISLLEGLGQTERGIEQQRLDRQYAQQQEQRMAPLQATKFIQGFAPQYQASQTIIEKDYRKPPDPYARALTTALGTYASLAPKQQQPTYTPTPQTQQSGGMMFTGYQPQYQQTQQPQFFNAAQGYQAFQPQNSQLGLGAYMPPPPAPVAPQMPQQGIYGAPQAYRGTYA